MRTLVLGVIDQRYDNKGADEATTTGEVAKILEDEYQIMERFYFAHEDDVQEMLNDSIQGQIENLLVGAPAPASPFEQANSEIKSLFDRFITEREMDHMGVPGVPTQASLGGKSKRFKSGESGTVRPSFVDSSLYLNSFIAWVE